MEAEEGLLFIDPRMQLPRKAPTDWGVPTCGQRGIYSESLGPGEKGRVLHHGQQGRIRKSHAKLKTEVPQHREDWRTCNV